MSGLNVAVPPKQQNAPVTYWRKRVKRENGLWIYWHEVRGCYVVEGEYRGFTYLKEAEEFARQQEVE